MGRGSCSRFCIAKHECAPSVFPLQITGSRLSASAFDFVCRLSVSVSNPKYGIQVQRRHQASRQRFGRRRLSHAPCAGLDLSTDTVRARQLLPVLLYARWRPAPREVCAVSRSGRARPGCQGTGVLPSHTCRGGGVCPRAALGELHVLRINVWQRRRPLAWQLQARLLGQQHTPAECAERRKVRQRPAALAFLVSSRPSGGLGRAGARGTGAVSLRDTSVCMPLSSQLWYCACGGRLLHAITEERRPVLSILLFK